VPANRHFWLSGYLVLGRRQYGFSTAQGSDGKSAFHLRRLELSFCTFPMAIDVGGHLQR
jgi:hypothetical protein